MKKSAILMGLLAVVLFTSFTVKETSITTTCDVANFYRAVEPKDSDTRVLTSSGDLEEVEVILVPTKLDIDTYKVKLTRKGANLYKVEQTDMYIETKYCSAYANYEEAILKVTSSYGYTKGTLIFD